MFAVLVNHVNPFRDVAGYWATSRVIDTLTGFGVPVFLLAAGYLFSLGVQKHHDLGARWWRATKRLGLLFAAWSLIYAAFPARGDWSSPAGNLLTAAREAREHPWMLLFDGTEVHLWFLPALWMGLSIVAWGAARNWLQAVMALGGCLFVIGSLGHSYAGTPAGVPWPFPVASRHGPMISVFYVALGYYWAQIKYHPRLAPTLIWMLGGAILSLAEGWWLAHVLGVPYSHHATLFGKAALGIGLFLVALRWPTFGHGTWLPMIGRYTLGVYATHLLVIRLLHPLQDQAAWIPPLIREPFEVLVVYVGAVALMAVLAQLKPTRRLVT